MSATKADFRIWGNATHKELKTGMSKSENPKPYAILTLAVDSRKEGGVTSFHTVVIWNEGTINYLKARYHQGMFLIVEGRTENQTIIHEVFDKDGNPKTIREVRAWNQAQHIFDPSSVVSKKDEAEAAIAEGEAVEEALAEAIA